jgi:hypothetical protein
LELLSKANLLMASLRKREVVALKAPLDSSFLLTIKEKATMNSSIVQNDVAKPELEYLV